MGFEPKLFNYPKRYSEVLKRGAIYWPGEAISKFGLQRGIIKPVMVKDGLRFEWGEIVCLDENGKARKVAETDTGTEFFGIVDRNASSTYGVLDTQVMGMAPRLTLSVFAGKRQGSIAVPVQNIHTYDVSNDIDTTVEVTNGAKVYVRIAESTARPNLPIGGIETVEIDGETVEWVGAKFTEPVMFPFAEEKYADEGTLTNAVAGIEL